MYAVLDSECWMSMYINFEVWLLFCSSERVSCHPERHPEHPEHPAPVVEVEVGDMRETPTKGAGPPEQKRKDWSSGPRSVRDLIRKFQGHVEEASGGSRDHSLHFQPLIPTCLFPNVLSVTWLS